MQNISPIGESNLEPLDFVWLELTNRCNLQCVHCYAESSPTSGATDALGEQDYLNLIAQVYGLGCRKIQFIGGEPTLNASLPLLIQFARDIGFEFVEVFTNLIRLPDSLLAVFKQYDVAVATSFYSYDSQTHDRITRQVGSFRRTTANISRVLDAGLRLRAGIITMEENHADLQQTWEFLAQMGVQSIGTDHVREIGRACDSDSSSMSELCGSCAGNILTIGSDGVVAPCNMSKQWSVGSVLEQNLQDIVGSAKLSAVREQIRSAVPTSEGGVHAVCDPKTCGPYSSCCPSTQSCFPCAPNGCTPCYPKG